MAMDFAKPATSDNYTTAFVPNILANQIALAQWLDSSVTTITGTPATNAKRYNATSGLIQKWDGTAWVTLPMSISGGTVSATTGNFSGSVQVGAGSNGTASVTPGGASQTGYLAFGSAGGVRQGYIGFATSTGAIDAGTIPFVMGAAVFSGVVYATNFSGAGTSLTGTAAGLNIGGNAARVGGLTPSATGALANRVVAADASGYIYNNYFNSTDNSSASGVTAVMVKVGDDFLRSGTPAAVATFLSGQTMNITGSSTACSGNAATATVASSANAVVWSAVTSKPINAIAFTTATATPTGGVSGDIQFQY